MLIVNSFVVHLLGRPTDLPADVTLSSDAEAGSGRAVLVHPPPAGASTGVLPWRERPTAALASLTASGCSDAVRHHGRGFLPAESGRAEGYYRKPEASGAEMIQVRRAHSRANASLLVPHAAILYHSMTLRCSSEICSARFTWPDLVVIGQAAVYKLASVALSARSAALRSRLATSSRTIGSTCCPTSMASGSKS